MTHVVSEPKRCPRCIETIGNSVDSFFIHVKKEHGYGDSIPFAAWSFDKVEELKAFDIDKDVIDYNARLIIELIDIFLSGYALVLESKSKEWIEPEDRKLTDLRKLWQKYAVRNEAFAAEIKHAVAMAVKMGIALEKERKKKD